MVTIPRSMVDGMTNAVNKSSAELQARLLADLKAIDYTGAGWVDEVVATMQGYCASGADISATLSSEWYKGIREAAIGAPGNAGAFVDRRPEATEKAVRGIVQQGVDGDLEGMFGQLQGRLDYEMKKQAAHTVFINGDKDFVDVRYARVPTGSETCSFCIMLASRGPVYLSEITATKTVGGEDHYHANCDCRIVPFFGTKGYGKSRMTSTLMQVEGYDIDALYDRYLDFMKDPKFAAALERTGHGTGANHHLSLSGLGMTKSDKWAFLKQQGVCKYGSIDEVLDALASTTTMDELYAVTGRIDQEWKYYGLKPDSGAIGRFQTLAKEKRAAFMAAGK